MRRITCALALLAMAAIVVAGCYGACAGAWPPLVQVTYAGRPLYTYTGDQKPGEANGNGNDQFGAEWYALQPDGQEPED